MKKSERIVLTLNNEIKPSTHIKLCYFRQEEIGCPSRRGLKLLRCTISHRCQDEPVYDLVHPVVHSDLDLPADGGVDGELAEVKAGAAGKVLKAAGGNLERDNLSTSSLFYGSDKSSLCC